MGSLRDPAHPEESAIWFDSQSPEVAQFSLYVYKRHLKAKCID